MTQHTQNYLRGLMQIKALDISPSKPFTWTSGKKMPLYLDNRMAVYNSNLRKTIAQGLKELASEDLEEFEYITGVPTAGIPHAALLAFETGKKLIILPKEGQGEGVFYPKKKLNFLNEKIGDFKGIIATTEPLALSFGIVSAQEKELPFLFVRSKQKDKGKMTQIEGLPKELDEALEQEVFLFAESNEKANSAKEALLEKGFRIKSIYVVAQEELVEECSLEGKRILPVEDLISSGGSTLEVIQRLESMGAKVNSALALFSYGFANAKENLKDYEIKTIGSLSSLVPLAKEYYRLSEEETALLASVQEYGMEWGFKNNFPPSE